MFFLNMREVFCAEYGAQMVKHHGLVRIIAFSVVCGDFVRLFVMFLFCCFYTQLSFYKLYPLPKLCKKNILIELFYQHNYVSIRK